MKDSYSMIIRLHILIHFGDDAIRINEESGSKNTEILAPHKFFLSENTVALHDLFPLIGKEWERE